MAAAKTTQKLAFHDAKEALRAGCEYNNKGRICRACKKGTVLSVMGIHCNDCRERLEALEATREAHRKDALDSQMQEILERRAKSLALPSDKHHEVIRHKEEIEGMQFLTQISAIRADEVVTKPQEWLYPNRIPSGAITYYVGKPDNAKSLSSTDLVARVSAGLDFPDCKNPNGPKKVLMYAGEDSIDKTVVPRLKAAGANLSNITLLDNKSFTVINQEGYRLDRREIDLSQDIPVINHLVHDHPDIALLVLDPITGVFGSKNTNRDDEMRPIFNELRDMLDKRGLTIVAVAHTNKRSDASAIHQIQGASSMAAAPRAAWLFTSDPDSDDKHAHMMTCVKGNLADKKDGLKLYTKAVPVEGAGDHPMVVWGDGTPMTADDANQALKEKNVNRDAKRETAKALIMSLLMEESPRRSPDVYAALRAAGIADKTAERAADDLTNKEKQIIRRQKPHQKGWWMALPQHADQFEFKPDAKIPDSEVL